jgi:hypothetical protein
MTTNEAIARWMPRRLHDSATAREDERILDGDLFTVSTGSIMLATPGLSCEPWSPDTDIALWHGPGGILAEIEKKGLMRRFIDSLRIIGVPREPQDDWRGVFYALAWSILCAEPAQLAATLRKCIEGETHP